MVRRSLDRSTAGSRRSLFESRHRRPGSRYRGSCSDCARPFRHRHTGMDGGKASIRIRVTAGILIAAVLAFGGCNRTAPNAKKLIVLGIDGMDPGFLERHWAALPNLDRLR